MDVSHKLHREIEAAKTLRANLADIIGDDEQCATDMVEAETSLNEAIDAVVSKLLEDMNSVNALGSMMVQLQLREHRLQQRIANTKTALAAALEQAGLKKFEHAVVTLSVRATAPSVVVTDEAAIPARYWKSSEPKLDKKAVLTALKAKEEVSGATLSNGGTCIAFSWS